MKISLIKIIGAIAWCLILCCAAQPAAAQGKAFAVSGRVTDTKGAPVIGATITVDRTMNGTTTASDGSYRITVREGDLLRFSFMGCVTQEFTASAALSHLDVTLEEDAQQIGDVVVIGYGAVQKKDLTGSIESLSGTEIAKAMTVNPADALNGRVSGVLVTKASNRPGADMSIQIRGLNSFNYSNEPLYVIDGVPSSSGMRHINPEDIESIDILKDASSCAIYGSRGANGVVIVTTKGVNNKEGFTIEYSGYAGLKTPTRIPDMLGSKGDGMEYVDFRIKQWTTKFGASSLSTDAFLTPNERRHIKHGEYYDWLREFSRNAVTTNHSLSASGSTASTSYTFGVGYMQDGGLAGSENFSRLTANVGLEYRVREKARIGMRAYMSHNKINHGSDEALLNAYYITPIVGRYEPDGTPTFSHRPGGRVNPFVQDANTKNESDGWSYNVSAYLSYTPVEHLTLKTQFATQYDGAVNGYWTGTDSQYGQGVKDPYATRSEGYNQNWVWDNTVTYENTFRDKHKLSVIALFSMQKDLHQGSGMTGEGLPYDSDWHAIHTAEQITNVNSNYWESAMVSVMGRVNYVFREKYLFTVTARYDGTSRLARGNRWGLLPSAAVGWSIRNENFLRDKEWLNTLKLRLSWGKTGNNNIGYNVTRTQLSLSPYMLGGSGIKGFGLGGSLGNENLKWEMTSEWNAGLDFGFLANRLTGMVDVYFRKTTDLIFQRQVADLNGYNSILQNIGTTQNRGVEFTLNSVNIDKRNFKWKTNLVFSLNRNKILDLDGTKTDDLANRRFIGKPMNVYEDNQNNNEVIWAIQYGADKNFNGAGNPIHAQFGFNLTALYPGMFALNQKEYSSMQRDIWTNPCVHEWFRHPEIDTRYGETFRFDFDINDPSHADYGEKGIYMPRWNDTSGDSHGAAYFYPFRNASGGYNWYPALALMGWTTDCMPMCRKFRETKIDWGGKGTREDVVIRLADTYLLAAEAYLLAGNPGKALEKVNILLRRAAGTEENYQTMKIRDEAEMTLDRLLEERGCELFGEHDRWFDLKRTGTLLTRARLNPLVAHYDNLSEIHLVRPIPYNERIKLEGLTQNPGYNN